MSQIRCCGSTMTPMSVVLLLFLFATLFSSIECLGCQDEIEILRDKGMPVLEAAGCSPEEIGKMKMYLQLKLNTSEDVKTSTTPQECILSMSRVLLKEYIRTDYKSYVFELGSKVFKKMQKKIVTKYGQAAVSYLVKDSVDCYLKNSTNDNSESSKYMLAFLMKMSARDERMSPSLQALAISVLDNLDNITSLTYFKTKFMPSTNKGDYRKLRKCIKYVRAFYVGVI